MLRLSFLLITFSLSASAQATIEKPPVAVEVPTPAMKVGNGVMPPVPVHREEPKYTKEARKKKIEGTVVISCVVDANGNVQDPKVNSGIHPDLDKNALEAARKWRFKPGTKDGVPVPVYAVIEVTFKHW